MTKIRIKDALAKAGEMEEALKLQKQELREFEAELAKAIAAELGVLNNHVVAANYFSSSNRQIRVDTFSLSYGIGHNSSPRYVVARGPILRKDGNPTIAGHHGNHRQEISEEMMDLEVDLSN